MRVGNDSDLETLHAVQVLGIVARAEDGEVCFYSEADADGVPAIDNPEGLEAAMLAASDRWVASEDVLRMFRGFDAIVCDR